jgi:tetratricopeptide (TPR) repeat protein
VSVPRGVLAAALLTLAAGGSLSREPAEPSALSPRALLDRGEARLAAGDVDAALQDFERAATENHLAEAEISLVRALLQQGEMRRALAFAAHAAGAHPEDPRAAALYAWLLHLGSQPQLASRVLDTAQAAAPTDEQLLDVRKRLAQPWLVPDADMLRPPARFAPYADHLPEPAAVVGTAVLFDGGTRALVPSATLANARAAWLRNGIGTTVRASLEKQLDASGLALSVLRLERSLPMPAELEATARAPFAGSIGYALEYATTPGSAQPAWPQMQLGFFGRAPSQASAPLLGIEMPTGPRGGPVFDVAGRFAGIAVRGPDEADRLLDSAVLESKLGAVFGAPSATPPSPRIAQDLLYERALLLALQVIVEPVSPASAPPVPPLLD